jgi:hypothetical protein
VAKPRVYLETTVISYLTGRTSRNVVVAGHQAITRQWWEHRERFDLLVSQAVIDEAKRGDKVVAARRVEHLVGIPALDLSDEVYELARTLIAEHAVPETARIDAIHIAVSAVNHMAYLMTWNFAHIANAALRGKIEQTCRSAGLTPPIICTPEELMEDAP